MGEGALQGALYGTFVAYLLHFGGVIARHHR